MWGEAPWFLEGLFGGVVGGPTITIPNVYNHIDFVYYTLYTHMNPNITQVGLFEGVTVLIYRTMMEKRLTGEPSIPMILTFTPELVPSCLKI